MFQIQSATIVDILVNIDLIKCEKCGSDNLDYATRIIGYLKRVSKFAEARIKEAKIRFYGKFTS